MCSILSISSIKQKVAFEIKKQKWRCHIFAILIALKAAESMERVENDMKTLAASYVFVSVRREGTS